MIELQNALNAALTLVEGQTGIRFDITNHETKQNSDHIAVLANTNEHDLIGVIHPLAMLARSLSLQIAGTCNLPLDQDRKHLIDLTLREQDDKTSILIVTFRFKDAYGGVMGGSRRLTFKDGHLFRIS